MNSKVFSDLEFQPFTDVYEEIIPIGITSLIFNLVIFYTITFMQNTTLLTKKSEMPYQKYPFFWVSYLPAPSLTRIMRFFFMINCLRTYSKKPFSPFSSQGNSGTRTISTQPVASATFDAKTPECLPKHRIKPIPYSCAWLSTKPI